MTFPKARKGVRLIFISELIAVLASLVGILSATFTLLADAGVDFAIALDVFLILIIVELSIPLICFVIRIIGTFIASNDEPYFKNALFIDLFAMIINVAELLLVALINDKDTSLAQAILDAVIDGSSVAVMMYIIIGVSVLAQDLGYEKFATRGNILIKFLVAICAFSIFMLFFRHFFPNPSITMSEVLTYIEFFGSLFEVILYLLFVIYLARSLWILKK